MYQNIVTMIHAFWIADLVLGNNTFSQNIFQKAIRFNTIVSEILSKYFTLYISNKCCADL